MPRVIGIDPGTVSIDLCGLDRDQVFLDCSLPTAQALQDPSALVEFGGSDVEAFPFLSVAAPTAGYLAWAALWVAMMWGLAAASFARKDL